MPISRKNSSSRKRFNKYGGDCLPEQLQDPNTVCPISQELLSVYQPNQRVSSGRTCYYANDLCRWYNTPMWNRRDPVGNPVTENQWNDLINNYGYFNEECSNLGNYQAQGGRLRSRSKKNNLSRRSKLKMRGGMKIIVKTLLGTKHELDVNLSNTVRDLKEQIALLEKVPAERQRIIFAGIQLDNDRTLADYNIQENNLLHVVIRSLPQLQQVPELILPKPKKIV